MSAKPSANRLRALPRDDSGVAAVEFAFLASVLCMVFLNACDLAIYLFDRIQVQNAAEMGVQAAWKSCDLDHLPASSKCSNLQSSVSAGVHSTSLGNLITLDSGMPAEGYYCVNGSNALQYVSDTSTRPADCSAAGVPSNAPGDYIKVQVSYPYAPLFGGVSVGGLLGTSIHATAMMRLG